ncbi:MULTISPECIES: hypothetical protein [Sphingobacterium]|uniref:Lipoprotein n=1 Tax=Sphingobacterium kitahiroshimense TaxID=470446 RepID=A0ABV0BXJ3_9SPHI|nr:MULTISPECIES: hypothetical protein [Sphingobacterium]MCW2259445.1 NAD-specific glutamate dehydrogenase [Sphingobacterium kitahiroshimense]NJI72458.1 hypothetical protein [Sphingobacterium sp. B16(2022)]TCR14107.1 hypothetical protein EDF67_101210 [Sphingobacterium sp. JUb78]
MKRVLLYFLSVLMLFQACWGVVVVSAFYINRDYIAQYLCENRDAPQLHCKGTCVLMKKMKKAREDEKKNIENKIKEAQAFVLIPSTVLNMPAIFVDHTTNTNFDMRHSHYTFNRINRILRPPSC